jgi:cytosine/creatinine deaminase
VTAAGARAHGVASYGLVVGAPADLCAVAASGVPEAIAAQPPRKWVMKAGRLVARDGVRLDEHDRSRRGDATPRAE